MGAAIKAAREAQSLSAVKLAARTEDLGCPIHRVGITKIEAGERALTVPELLVIAAALGTTPLALIFASPINESIEVLPGKYQSTVAALGWFTGTSGETPNGVARDDHSARRAQLLLRINEIDTLIENQRQTVEQSELAHPMLLSDEMPPDLRSRLAYTASNARVVIEGLSELREHVLGLLDQLAPLPVADMVVIHGSDRADFDRKAERQGGAKKSVGKTGAGARDGR
jgi:transcriptional regulator with XRE-family HTH domain